MFSLRAVPAGEAGANRLGVPVPAHRRLLGVLLAAVVLLTAQIDVLASQSIRGTVRDGATDEPVGVALVALEDTAGRRAATTLTNARGQFLIRAPGPGHYRVTIERIGFRSHNSEPFDLAAGEDHSLELRIRTEAIRLDAIVVRRGRGRCLLPREEGAEIATLWDEARKSLELAVWGEEEAWAYFRVRAYERVLDLITEDVREQRMRTWSGTAREPFVARPAEELAREGFVVDDGDGHYTYYGLTARTILSDAFQETHCFRVQRPGRDQPAGEIGLAFEPAPGRSPADVAGVLWLDRGTAELRRVEYTYTRHPMPLPLPIKPFGGRTDFRRFANGAVIADAWWIRMPRFESVVHTDQLPPGATITRYGDPMDRERMRDLRRVGLTIREVGARAVPVGGAGPDDDASGVGVIDGVIHDSIADAALRGANVYVVGGRRHAVTDDAGRFRLDGVPSGTWDLTFDHPSVDVLGWAAEPMAVTVLAGDTLRVDLATASVATVLGARCEDGDAWVAGFVRARADGAPVAGVLVVTEWVEGWRREGAGFTGDSVRRGAITDEAGAYVLCDVRPGARRRIEVEGHPGSARTVEVWAGEGARLDFAIAP